MLTQSRPTQKRAFSSVLFDMSVHLLFPDLSAAREAEHIIAEAVCLLKRQNGNGGKWRET